MSGGNDWKLRFWSVPGLERLLTKSGHKDHVTNVAVSPDGTTVASASADDTVKLWKLELPSSTSGPQPELKAH